LIHDENYLFFNINKENERRIKKVDSKELKQIIDSMVLKTEEKQMGQNEKNKTFFQNSVLVFPNLNFIQLWL
jgi:hypothetical protein